MRSAFLPVVFSLCCFSRCLSSTTFNVCRIGGEGVSTPTPMMAPPPPLASGLPKAPSAGAEEDDRTSCMHKQGIGIRDWQPYQRHHLLQAGIMKAALLGTAALLHCPSGCQTRYSTDC